MPPSDGGARGYGSLFRLDRFSDSTPAWEPAPADERDATLSLLCASGMPADGGEVERVRGAELNSRNHRIRVGGATYVLKRAPESVGWARIVALADHLATHGVATPRSLGWPDGRMAVSSGELQVTRWSAAPGAHVSGTRAELLATGVLIARLRGALDALPRALAPSLQVTHDVGAMSASVRRALTRRVEWTAVLRPEGAHALDAGIGSLARAVDELVREASNPWCEKRGAIHVDLHPHNVLWDRDEERITLLDLDSVREGPVAVELAFACAKLGRQAIAGGHAASPAEAVGWILEGWRRGGGANVHAPALRLAAQAEIARRAVLILDLAERERDLRWVGVLDIQLTLLAELDALFSEAPSALPGPVASERGARLTALAHEGLGARRAFEAELARHAADVRDTALATVELAATLPYAHVGLSATAYFAHPMRVAALALRHAADPAACVVRALVHNVLEVAPSAGRLVRDMLGSDVMRDLEVLTIDRSQSDDDAYVAAYYDRIVSAGPAVSTVKVLDKLDNLFVLHLNPDDAMRHRYLCEIERHVIPLAERVLPALSGTVRALADDARRLGYVPVDAGRARFPYPGRAEPGTMPYVEASR